MSSPCVLTRAFPFCYHLQHWERRLGHHGARARPQPCPQRPSSLPPPRTRRCAAVRPNGRGRDARLLPLAQIATTSALPVSCMACSPLASWISDGRPTLVLWSSTTNEQRPLPVCPWPRPQAPATRRLFLPLPKSPSSVSYVSPSSASNPFLPGPALAPVHLESSCRPPSSSSSSLDSFCRGLPDQIHRCCDPPDWIGCPFGRIVATVVFPIGSVITPSTLSRA